MNSNINNLFRYAVDPFLLEHPSMSFNNIAGMSSDSHEQQPITHPNDSIPILPSKASNNYHDDDDTNNNNRNSTAQSGYQLLSPLGNGPSLTDMAPPEDLKLILIRNASRQFVHVTCLYDDNHERSYMHPLAVSLLGYNPIELHESLLDICKPFRLFVTLVVRLDGCAEARLMEFLVCDEDITYNGIDLHLGRRFVTGKDTNKSLTYAPEKKSIFSPQTSTVFPKTLAVIPPSVSAWDRGHIESNAEGSSTTAGGISTGIMLHGTQSSQVCHCR